MSRTLHYSERVYRALLFLYPVPFRVRFAAEMEQVFHDCCREALHNRNISAFAAYWLWAARDLCSSVLRERVRELATPAGFNLSFVGGIVDVMLIPSIAIVNLLALGPIVTLLFFGGLRIPLNEFVRASGFVSFLIGVLTLLISLILNRVRPTVRLWLKIVPMKASSNAGSRSPKTDEILPKSSRRQ